MIYGALRVRSRPVKMQGRFRIRIVWLVPTFVVCHCRRNLPRSRREGTRGGHEALRIAGDPYSGHARALEQSQGRGGKSICWRNQAPQTWSRMRLETAVHATCEETSSLLPHKSRCTYTPSKVVEERHRGRSRTTLSLRLTKAGSEAARRTRGRDKNRRGKKPVAAEGNS